MTVGTHRSHGGIVEACTERTRTRRRRGEFRQMRAHVATIRDCLARARAGSQRKTFRTDVNREIESIEMLKPLPVLCGISHEIADLTSLLGEHVVEAGDSIASSVG